MTRMPSPNRYILWTYLEAPKLSNTKEAARYRWRPGSCHPILTGFWTAIPNEAGEHHFRRVCTNGILTTVYSTRTPEIYYHGWVTARSCREISASAKRLSFLQTSQLGHLDKRTFETAIYFPVFLNLSQRSLLIMAGFVILCKQTLKHGTACEPRRNRVRGIDIW